MSARARRWLAANAEFERLVEDGVVRALPQYDDRTREQYLTDVERREKALANYDDAKQRFSHFNTLNAVRLPQPQSGRAWYERQRAVSDFDFFWKELVVALLKEER